MASYTPTSTSANDYTKTLQTGDRIYGTAGQTIPITVPAGSYHLNCFGAQGGSGYYSSKGSNYTNVTTNSTYCSWTLAMGTAGKSGNLANDKYQLVVYGQYSTLEEVAVRLDVKKAGVYDIRVTPSGTYDNFRIYDKKGNELKKITSSTGVTIPTGDISLNAGDYISIYLRMYSPYSIGWIDIQLYEAPSFVDSITQPGGYGGYAYGIITLKKPTTMYLVTGTQSGFNGGGKKATYTSSSRITYAGSGGGASDIRIGTNDLNHRVIVAGGGGGSAGGSDLTLKRGGGPSGASPNALYQATQSTAGTNGSFGQGANASNSSTYGYGPGGGGGGWYGGGAGSNSVNDTAANGGGSGYVLTSSSHQPTGYALGSEYYLINTRNEFGTQEGDGYIVVICEELAPQKFFYYKTEVGWKPAVAIFKKTEDGWRGGEI